MGEGDTGWSKNYSMDQPCQRSGGVGGPGGLGMLKTDRSPARGYGVAVFSIVLLSFPGPQLPAQATSLPLNCASAPAAKAPASSWRTCTHWILPLRRTASVIGFKLSPTIP